VKVCVCVMLCWNLELNEAADSWAQCEKMYVLTPDARLSTLDCLSLSHTQSFNSRESSL